MSRKKKKRSYIRVCYKFPRWTEETKNGTKFFWSVAGFHFAAGNSHRVNFIHNVSNGSFQHPLEIPSLSQFGTTLAPLFSPRQIKSLMGQPVLRGVTIKWGVVTISSGPPSLTWGRNKQKIKFQVDFTMRTGHRWCGDFPLDDRTPSPSRIQLNIPWFGLLVRAV